MYCVSINSNDAVILRCRYSNPASTINFSRLQACLLINHVLTGSRTRSSQTKPSTHFARSLAHFSIWSWTSGLLKYCSVYSLSLFILSKSSKSMASVPVDALNRK